MGSRAYGLAGPDSDIDRRGVYVAPTNTFWHFSKPPSHVDGPLPEQFSWEIERCCELALKANPTVLEFLWSPLVEQLTSTGSELLAIRQAFLSLRARDSYIGYAESQFRRVDADFRRDGKPKWKHVMHCLRLLLSGEHLLRHCEPMVDVGEQRDKLLAVRAGEIAWPDVVVWKNQLQQAIQAAADATKLPTEPDLSTVDDFLFRVREGSAKRLY